MHAPSRGFNFMQFQGNFGKIVCWRPLEGWRSHLGEILDPPLDSTLILPPMSMTLLPVLGAHHFWVIVDPPLCEGKVRRW